MIQLIEEGWSAGDFRRLMERARQEVWRDESQAFRAVPRTVHSSK